MASGFTYSQATALLKSVINEETLIGLSTTVPAKDGSNFTEPSGNGYRRAQFGAINDSKAGQIANDDIIFFFVAIGDIGSVSHLGLIKSIFDSTPFFVAQLENPLTISENYVPLIREHKLIIGLDIDTLDTSY